MTHAAESWRSITPKLAQDDLDDLLSAGLELAEERLNAHGDFMPFAVTTDDEGHGRLLVADPAVVGDSPTSVEVLAYLFDQLRVGREAYRATGVFYDATSNRGDVIQAELEHFERVALAVQAPYRLDGTNVQLGELSAARGTPRLWV